MTDYKVKKSFDNTYSCILRNNADSIPLVTGNTDYANFKREILADKAQLQDADGNVMSADAAKEFIKTLP